MNKYLTKRNELEKILEKEFDESGYSVFEKMNIAVEVENVLEWDDFKNFNITDEQQENIIDIIYDFYLSCEDNTGLFKLTKAILFTMLDYGTYFDFIGAYETNYSKVYDKFCWKL